MRVHFIGIAGSSMSNIATMLEDMGHTVTGSDMTLAGSDSTYAVENSDLVVFTSAIPKENREFKLAEKLAKPLVERAEMLGAISRGYDKVIAVSGTHGKSTTTALIGSVISSLRPTVQVGAKLAHGSGYIAGGKKYFVTEACEYRESFRYISPYLAVITNIELDHTDYYANIDEVRRSFASWATKSEILLIRENDSQYISHGEKITFGEDNASDYYFVDKSSSEKSVIEVFERGESLGLFPLSIRGKHNYFNALASIATARILGVSASDIARGLDSYKGIKRRYEYMGELNGCTLISDFAHHPREVESTIKFALESGKKVRVVFQPHTYTRTKSFFSEFVSALSLADEVAIMDIYGAREQALDGVSSRMIASKIKGALYIPSFAVLKYYLITHCKPNEITIIMGAGDIIKIFDTLK